MDPIDTIVYAKHAITMESDSMIDDAAIAVTDGKIIAVDSAVQIDMRYEPREKISFSHHLAMPGMINAHGHCPMIPYRGKLPSDAPFQDVVFKHMLPLEDDFCAKKDFVYLSTRWALAEMQAGGVTTSAEMYYFVDDMAKAFRECNMRGILGETVMTKGTHRFSDPADLFYHMSGIVGGSDDLVTFAIAPHAPYTCEDPELLRCITLAITFQIPYLMHANETKEEVNSLFFASRYGERDPPLVTLARLGLLNHDRITLAHCNHLAPEEYAVLKNYAIGVAHNPVCNAGIGLSTADLFALQSHGIPVGLATDGPMTNDRLDLLSQLKPAQLLHRMRQGTSEGFCPYAMVKTVTSDAARALHRDDIGILSQGRFADIAILDVSDPAAQCYMKNKNPFGFLVSYAQAAHVSATMVGGKLNEKKDITHVIDEMMPYLDKIAAWTPRAAAPAGDGDNKKEDKRDNGDDFHGTNS